MRIAVVTGSTGLIGSATVRFYAERGYKIIGIDNDMRKYFFGEDASTSWNRLNLEKTVPDYKHYDINIRNKKSIFNLFAEIEDKVQIVIHTAAQPSHDWATKDPMTDLSVNATGTLVLLEAVRKYCPEAVFIFTSTNKVYGDAPNSLPFIENKTRWELDPSHKYYNNGIDELMSIDQSKHSLFGASKAAADILVQEYGRYFGMKTGVFRGGCLTGGGHSGVELHGFLSYLMKCCIEGRKYTIFGYKGKQVRDNIHSWDLVNMFWHFSQNPQCGAVYNAGGSRHSHCSMMEAIALCEDISKKKLEYEYFEKNRVGDHIWYISDISKFRKDYPHWDYQYDLNAIMEEIYLEWLKRTKD